jgi:hypothetical protein
MPSRPPRPALQPPELDAPPPPPSAPRPAPDDPRFRVAEALERPEALREAVAVGRVRALNAHTAEGVIGGGLPPLAAGQVPAPSPRRTAPEVALSTKVPDYVLKQLRRRYAEDGITIRNQVLLALRLAGVEVDERDITDERKHPPRRGR